MLNKVLMAVADVFLHPMKIVEVLVVVDFIFFMFLEIVSPESFVVPLVKAFFEGK